MNIRLRLVNLLKSCAILNLAVFSYIASAQPLAFPEADGFGRFTEGGRGGQVYIITSLDDSANNPKPGTLRHAVQQQGARTIVFDVSGIIQLQDRLEIKHDNITIAGQSSPGGIVLRGAPLIVSANQVIIRYMRFRLGLVNNNTDAASGRDQHHIIFDHCSFSWSIDEVASFYDNQHFTLQYSIVAQSLNHATHIKGDHGYGGIWGGSGASFHHNIIAHNVSRSPRIHGHRYVTFYPQEEELTDLRNNVVYNWGSYSAYGSENGLFNFVDNTYIMGPASNSPFAFQFYVTKPNLHYGQGFFRGNLLLDSHDQPIANIVNIDPSQATEKPALKSLLLDSELTASQFPKLAMAKQYARADTRQNSYNTLIEHAEAGANRNAFGKAMDSVDKGIIGDIKARRTTFGNKGIINSELDVIGSWQKYAKEFITTQSILDKDRDGMDDHWEARHKVKQHNGHELDPNYTNIEMYLNELGRFRF